MALTRGQTFAGYTIIRLLGSGGMGEVYLAQHPRLPRRDALKLLPHDWSADTEYRARFNREADLASTLWHQHIVGVHDRGEEDGQLWISMDFVDGLDAARLLADRYPAGMPVEEVARIVTAVASALDYAHKQHLLHRDVKPANIMMTHLDDDGEQRILLTDFGIARNVNDISGLTKTNMTVGTVAYCAPEQLLGEDVDGRADQYSLAATAFHLLTGSQLFPNSNPAVVISRHLNMSPPALADKRPDLANLDPVLAIGLAKRPEDRFKRCSEFAAALSEQINSAGARTQAAPTCPAPVTSVAPEVGAVGSHGHSWNSKLARSRLIALCAILFAVMLIAGLLFAWRPWQWQSTTRPSESPGPTTSMVQVAPPVITTAVHPPPLVPPHAIDQLLLTVDQLTKALGAKVTSDPSAGGPGGLGLNFSSYGMADHSGQVTPRSCVGVIFTGEHGVYTPAAPSEIKTQTFGTPNGINPGSPHLVQQTAAVFPSAEKAQQLFASSQATWKACAAVKVDATFGYESGAGYSFGGVLAQNEMITLTMASTNNLGPTNGADACQQALGTRENVVVEVRTCEAPNLTAPPDFPDVAWAVPDAERVAKAMLANVGT
jgi:serine/threonine-protein kinase